MPLIDCTLIKGYNAATRRLLSERLTDAACSAIGADQHPHADLTFLFGPQPADRVSRLEVFGIAPVQARADDHRVRHNPYRFDPDCVTNVA